MNNKKITLNISRDVFNEKYIPYLYSYDKRYEVYYGGSGSGKSVFITQKIIIKLLSEKRKLLTIRKVGNTLKDSVFQLYIEILGQWKILKYCIVNKTDYTIILPNGSTILCKGLDDPEKIKSITGIDDIWIEESTELSLDDFTQLNLRLRSNKKNPQIFLSFNPTSKANWVYQTYFKDGYDELTTRVLKTTYKDNKFLPKNYIEALEMLIKTNPIYYRIYAKGEFCSLDKLVFSNWEKKDLNVIELKQRTDLELLIGLDFGFTNDPTTIITSLLDEKNRVIYIIDEFYEKGLTNDKIAVVIKYKNLSKSVIIADSAEQKSIEEIRKNGVRRIKGAFKGKDSINIGIDKLKQYKIYINSICYNTITEFENYSYKKDKNTNEYLNEPKDEFNHCIDALRYSLQCIDKPTVQVFDKSLLGL